MKKFIILIAILLFSPHIFAETTTLRELQEDSLEYKMCHGTYIINDDNAQPLKWFIRGSESTKEKYDIEVAKPQYTPEALLVWGMQNILTQEPVISMSEAQRATVIYYFGRFADNCTPAGRDLFLMAATSMGLADLANAIIAKAIELGADITQE